MKIVFMGTPEFAVPSLEILVENNIDIAMVVTQPDRPRGRGHKVTFSPVKNCAIQNNIPVIQPEKIGSSECVEMLSELEPDLFVTCAFGQFLTREILDIPKYGTVNVHGSLLPKYRGAAPIQWAIINGEKKTGVTTMLTVLKLDAGDILLTKEIEIDDDMTAGHLHDKMSVVGAELLIETIQGLEKGDITPIPQNDVEATYAPRISRDTGKIVWGNSARAIHNLVRGTNPWPIAYAYLNNERMRICKTAVYDEEKLTGVEPGTIIETAKDGFLVQTGKGIIKVFEVQCDNSRRMTVQEYVCGHTLNQGDCFES
ncbi:MAG: methionyl-tRNA formyltransferase [Clostridiaceae bacterium]|jgi:methionyl-tRNA formyltransferase|nr:methionyl-tRNA formyltransferase [Clostridiaceae bacterium]